MQKMSAYYKTEDDAESVKAKLETLKVDNLSVEPVPNDTHELVDIAKEIFSGDQGDEHAPQVLHFQVADEDAAEANKIIKDSEGYISRQ